MKKKIVIVDDHASLRHMLAWILMREAGYEIIGEAGSGIEALKACGRHQPDVLILDLVLPSISGTEVLRRVRREQPAVRVLIYSGTCNAVLIREALRERPHGYVEKMEGLNVLREAISTVAAGGNYYSDATRNLMCECRNDEPCGLSRREREILQLIAEGRSSKEICVMLAVALKTVENHRANLMAKLDRHDVASLTRYAAGQGMVALE